MMSCVYAWRTMNWRTVEGLATQRVGRPLSQCAAGTAALHVAAGINSVLLGEEFVHAGGAQFIAPAVTNSLVRTYDPFGRPSGYVLSVNDTSKGGVEMPTISKSTPYWRALKVCSLLFLIPAAHGLQVLSRALLSRYPTGILQAACS